MNNLTSYCGLVDAKIRASDNDLPVINHQIFVFAYFDIFEYYLIFAQLLLKYLGLNTFHIS